MANTERDYNSYVNADGLRQTYGTGEALVAMGGDYNIAGPDRISRFIISGTDLRDHDDGTDDVTVVDWHTRIPEGAYLVKGLLEVSEAFTSGGSATLNIGLTDASDQSYALTAHDEDGLLAALAKATLIAGYSVTLQLPSTDNAGALWGSTLTASGTGKGGFLVTAEPLVANFDDGIATLDIYWRPRAPDLSET